MRGGLFLLDPLYNGGVNTLQAIANIIAFHEELLNAMKELRRKCLLLKEDIKDPELLYYSRPKERFDFLKEWDPGCLLTNVKFEFIHMAPLPSQCSARLLSSITLNILACFFRKIALAKQHAKELLTSMARIKPLKSDSNAFPAIPLYQSCITIFNMHRNSWTILALDTWHPLIFVTRMVEL